LSTSAGFAEKVFMSASVWESADLSGAVGGYLPADEPWVNASQ
jgi:hypothetical protein